MTIDPNNLAGTAHLTFDEEFNSLNLRHNHSGSGIWNTVFNYDEGGYAVRNAWFVDADAAKTASVQPWTVSDGTLTIRADRAPSGLNADYTTGHLDTQGTFAQQYGYFEMSARMPAADTNAAPDSPAGGAFWLLPTDNAWPPEIDVVESTSWGAVYTSHSAASGSHTADSSWTDVPDISSAFHRYGVDWEADKITWYLDGKQVYQTATPADMHDPMFMLLNLYTTGQGAPGEMEVDYVRAYAAGSGGGLTQPTPVTVPPAAALPSATTPDAHSTATADAVAPTSVPVPPAAALPSATTPDNHSTSTADAVAPVTPPAGAEVDASASSAAPADAAPAAGPIQVDPAPASPPSTAEAVPTETVTAAAPEPIVAAPAANDPAVGVAADAAEPTGQPDHSAFNDLWNRFFGRNSQPAGDTSQDSADSGGFHPSCDHGYYNSAHVSTVGHAHDAWSHHMG